MSKNQQKIWKICDALRSKLPVGSYAAELARLGLALQRVRSNIHERFPTAAEFLAILNDPKLNREWGFNNFFPLSVEQLEEIFPLLHDIDLTALRKLIAAPDNREFRSFESNFPPAVFAAAVESFNFTSVKSIFVPHVENCSSLIIELSKKHPKLRINAHYRQSSLRGLLHFLFSDCSNVTLTEGSVDRSFETEFPLSDCIIYFGSFGMRLTDKETVATAEQRGFGRVQDANALFFWRFLTEAAPGARLFAQITEGFLFRSSEKILRERLLNSGALRRIIQLPDGCLRPSLVKSNLIELASPLDEDLSDRPVVIERFNYDGKLRSGWEYQPEKAQIESVEISRTELAALESWAVDRFFVQQVSLLKDDTRVVPLSNIATEIFRGAPVTIAKEDGSPDSIEIKVVNVKDLDRTKLVPKVLEKITVNSARPLNRYYLEDGDVLVSIRGLALHIALFSAAGDEPVVPSTNIAVVRPDRSKINPEFLACFLRSPAGQVSLLARQSGTTLLMLSTKELGTIPVPLLGLAEQERIAAAILDAEETKQREIGKIVDQYEKEVLRQYAEMGLNVETSIADAKGG